MVRFRWPFNRQPDPVVLNDEAADLPPPPPQLNRQYTGEAQLLIEMGFNPLAAVEELHTHGGNLQAALDALLQRRQYDTATINAPPPLPDQNLSIPLPLRRQRSAELRSVASAAAAAATHDADVITSPCLICMAEDGKPRPACGHTFCAECFIAYLESRIGERRVVELPCPALASSGCDNPNIVASEVALWVNAQKMRRYEKFIRLEQAEKNPDSRWCVIPDCGGLCLPWKPHPPPRPLFGGSLGFGR
mmetsp:Transcript_55955/g.112140  ORF Transcript_55955/g.112140 Transcript_55955/m.112140 type:complete len:248 (-) Transcript_55955:1139-1882(-)